MILKTKGFRSKNGCDYLQAVFLDDFVETYRYDATQGPRIKITEVTDRFAKAIIV